MKTEGVGFYSRVRLYYSGYGRCKYCWIWAYFLISILCCKNRNYLLLTSIGYFSWTFDNATLVVLWQKPYVFCWFDCCHFGIHILMLQFCIQLCLKLFIMTQKVFLISLHYCCEKGQFWNIFLSNLVLFRKSTKSDLTGTSMLTVSIWSVPRHHP